MTLAQTHAHGFGTPSHSQLWLTAMLRTFVELVLNVVSTLPMIRRRGPVIGTQVMPAALPRETNDILKEQQAVQQDSSLDSAHGEQRSFAARPSNHERVLTNVSHTSPSPSVPLASQAIHLPLLRRWRQEIGGELPPSVRSTGGVGLRTLARKTEGASHEFRSSRRKSGPRASRAMCVTGLRKQPWIPACAGMSGTRPAIQAPV